MLIVREIPASTFSWQDHSKHFYHARNSKRSKPRDEIDFQRFGYYGSFLTGTHRTTKKSEKVADTFDDVISTAVATGALASGNAGSALRGGVVA